MLVWAGFHLAAPFLWQVAGCLMAILDLISTDSIGQADNRDLGFLCASCLCAEVSKQATFTL